MTRQAVQILILTAILALGAQAGFINGNFETGDATGWLTGTGYRGSVNNNSLTPSMFLPGGSNYNAGLHHSGIVTPGFAPDTDNQLNQVYSGNHSWRVEDTTIGGYASAISQTVDSYTDPDIFFAWAAVLEGAHGTNDAATVIITLKDETRGDTLISRQYNAASGGGGVDQKFTLSSSGFYYTAWQIEQLSIPQDRQGDKLTLSILAADCQPTGHAGWLYLDGFGAVAPPTQDGTVPEPATFGLMIVAGVAAGVWKLRRTA